MKVVLNISKNAAKSEDIQAISAAEQSILKTEKKKKEINYQEI